jgi:two-component system alkaline phosphatase synthesis response regulator PhoP
MSSITHKKILIVEDERDILHLVKHYLEKEGFRTIFAVTGLEALKKDTEDRPDLVVLDLMLPEMDGLEVCKRLRSAPDTAMLPIIMLRPGPCRCRRSPRRARGPAQAAPGRRAPQ